MSDHTDGTSVWSTARKRRAIAAALLAAGLAALGAGRASAQVGAGQGGRAARANAGDPAAAPMSPAEASRLFDGYVLMGAREALTLTDAQFPEFVTKLMALQEARRRHQLARRQIVFDLARMAGPRAAMAFDEAKAREQIKALSDLDARASDEARRAQEALDQVLDVRQQARLRVFEEQVERKKLDLLLSARRSAAAQTAVRRQSDKRP